jgi:hypothetical protein
VHAYGDRAHQHTAIKIIHHRIHNNFPLKNSENPASETTSSYALTNTNAGDADASPNHKKCAQATLPTFLIASESMMHEGTAKMRFPERSVLRTSSILPTGWAEKASSAEGEPFGFGVAIEQLKGHTHSVNAVASSADGKLLASASGDN